MKIHTGFIKLRKISVVGFCEHCDKASSSLKYGDFLDQLSDYELTKKDSVPFSSYSKESSKVTFYLALLLEGMLLL
jgi:hypothetical protein